MSYIVPIKLNVEDLSPFLIPQPTNTQKEIYLCKAINIKLKCKNNVNYFKVISENIDEFRFFKRDFNAKILKRRQQN